ncbi:MAG: acetylglutamate kinase, partial [Candidatus Omnitrophica bacterium]|nr:acetylglutamate kinase [Candidatus Omnitrophota bacterium]
VKSIEEGVGKAHIVDAKIPHAILLEIFTNEGIGTEIIK